MYISTYDVFLQFYLKIKQIFFFLSNHNSDPGTFTPAELEKTN